MRPINLLLLYELSVVQLSLSNSDIKNLFNVTSDTTVARIKRPILASMAGNGIYLPSGFVCTRSAMQVWGISEEDLEMRYSKAVKYGLKGVV